MNINSNISPKCKVLRVSLRYYPPSFLDWSPTRGAGVLILLPFIYARDVVSVSTVQSNKVVVCVQEDFVQADHARLAVVLLVVLLNLHQKLLAGFLLHLKQLEGLAHFAVLYFQLFKVGYTFVCQLFVKELYLNAVPAISQMRQLPLLHLFFPVLFGLILQQRALMVCVA